MVYASNFLIFEVYPAWIIAKRQGTRLVVKLQHVLHSQTERQSAPIPGWRGAGASGFMLE